MQNNRSQIYISIESVKLHFINLETTTTSTSITDVKIDKEKELKLSSTTRGQFPEEPTTVTVPSTSSTVYNTKLIAKITIETNSTEKSEINQKFHLFPIK